MPIAARVLERLSAIGAAAQASVPGLYAWGSTVVPVAWSRGAPALAKVACLFAVAALAAGVAAEPRWGPRARSTSLWGFVIASALAWSAAPGALAPLRVDVFHGLAGMLGWALFGLASAAPALGGPGVRNTAPPSPSLPSRRGDLARGDAAYVAGGVVLAVTLQLFGWHAGTPERALLVRLVGLAAGLALVGACTSAAVARYGRRVASRPSARLRRGLAGLVTLGLLVLSGLLFAARG